MEATHVVTKHRGLDSLVCCDEAFPHMVTSHGHCGDLTELQTSAGTCASLHARGVLRVSYAVDTSMLSAAAQGNLVTRLVSSRTSHHGVARNSPLTAVTGLTKPDCLRFEIRDLARGEVFVDERCHGEELAGQLGEIDHDPTAELAASCAGEPYVCEVAVDFNGWDETRCRPWPEQQAVDEGCGCRTGGGLGVSTLLALALGLTLRRRRRGSAPPCSAS